MRTIGEICHRDVTVGTPDMTVGAVAKLMRHRHVGTVVIVDTVKGGAGMPIGIVTEHDIVADVTAADLNANALMIGDFMHRALVTAREDDSVLDAMRIMHCQGFHSLPIVGPAGELVGSVAIDDIFELLPDELGELIRIGRKRGHESALVGR